MRAPPAWFPLTGSLDLRIGHQGPVTQGMRAPPAWSLQTAVRFRWCPTCWLVLLHRGIVSEIGRRSVFDTKRTTTRAMTRGYQSFLRRAIDPIGDFLHPRDARARLWEWSGSGHAVVLGIWEYRAPCMTPFMPLRKPEGLFDLITCTETFEHFSSTGRVAPSHKTACLLREGYWPS